MKRNIRLLMPLLAALLLATPGCYLKRLTVNYKDIQELPESFLEYRPDKQESISNAEEQDNLLRQEIEETSHDLHTYTIDSGDTVTIKVYDHDELSVHETLITPDGYISMVLIGQVKVAGLTLDQAAAEIEKRLTEYIQHPKVGIIPVSIDSDSVTISGAIVKPGMYTIRHGMRLGDLYALAGGSRERLVQGVTMESAELATSIFIRKGKRLHVDFIRGIKEGDPLHNLEIHSDDYIYITDRQGSLVYVIGDVIQPKQCIWNNNLGLLEALADCGWLSETHWQNAIIIRMEEGEQQMYKVDLDGILQGTRRNVILKPGDIVYMPKDDLAEYNVFIRKLFPTPQFIRLVK